MCKSRSFPQRYTNDFRGDIKQNSQESGFRNTGPRVYLFIFLARNQHDFCNGMHTLSDRTRTANWFNSFCIKSETNTMNATKKEVKTFTQHSQQKNLVQISVTALGEPLKRDRGKGQRKRDVLVDSH